MPSLSKWSPYKQHVQGGLREGNFLNGQFILICAGPPFFHEVGLGVASDEAEETMVYPIGLTQNLALSQNKAISRIFEIGSDRSYFIGGRSVGQLSLGRVVYHGPSLLRAMYAYYDTANDKTLGSTQIEALTTASGAGIKPFATLGTGNVSAGLHSVQIPPGYDNMFLNLASDLFSQPMGLLLMFKDNNMNTIATVYLDQCYIPQHSLAVDSQGLIIQESIGIQYEKMVPVKLSQLNMIAGVLPDVTGGFGGGGEVAP
jgi:hypothetical protein